MTIRHSRAISVIPAFDYMDEVGRATQEAKTESRYDVHGLH